MLSQKLSDCISNGPLDLKYQTDSIRNASACSCSVCESISCFYIRNRKATLTCSCNHPKINEECVKHTTKEEKDELNEMIDCKKYETDVPSHTKCNLLDESKDEKMCEKLKAQSKPIAYDKNRRENPKAELSAQIMNVPYEEFKCSLSKSNNINNSDDNSNSPVFNINELVKPDILTRLKEIYKACSCKVCECITDKPLPKDLKANELCKCSPCDCNECVITQKIQKLEPRPNSGCPCVKCDRKDCRGVVKKSMGVSACDCSPCDCLNCTDTTTKSCTCEPCRCAECMINNGRQKPILSVNTQSTCHCKPCECENCTRVYTTMAANLIQDISKMFSCRYTKSYTYLNDLLEFNDDVCQSGQCEVTSFSDQISSYDYDINTTFVNDQLIHKRYNNFNTIAMMAMYSTNYSKVELNNTKNCKCLGCECLICTSRENEIRNQISKISLNDFHHDNIVRTSHSKSCDCEACQCEFCSHVQNKLARKLERLDDNCSCSVCDCLMCNEIACTNRKDCGITTRWARQEQGLPVQVTRDTSCTNVYPLRKGKLLVPSMFESNIGPSCLKSQLYYGNKNLGLDMKLKTHLHTKESSSKIFTNLKPNDVECDNSQRYERNIECPVRDIFSNNYLKNNNLHIGNNTSKDIHVPTKLNTATNIKDSNLNSLENHTTETNIFGTHSINCNEVTCSSNNPFYNLDKFKNVNIVLNDKVTTLQETNNPISNQSILSIFKSTSESILCDSVSRTKNITVLNNHKRDKVNLNLQDGDLANTSNLNFEAKTFNHDSKENLDASKTGVNNQIIKSEHNEPKQHKNIIVNNKSMYNKMYRRLMKRNQLSKKRKTLSKTKVSCINNKNEIDGKVNVIENLQVIVEDQNKKNLELTIKNKKTIDDFFSSEMNMLNKIKTDVQSIDNDGLTKPCTILQKNFYNKKYSDIRQNKGVCTIPDLELDVRHAVKLISQQKSGNYENKILGTQNIRYDYKYSDTTSQIQATTNQVDKKISCSILESVENLRNNMKYLLDLVLSRVMPMCKVNALPSTFDPVEDISSKLIKINPIENCDGLKANFIEIRRVSNHTLLVRWKLPQKTAYVQGYELQVDGRSVQKIIGPTRCMAVLTCLPRCEKLLLTIRTLTTVLLSDHYPATTIVYRPYMR